MTRGCQSSQRAGLENRQENALRIRRSCAGNRAVTGAHENTWQQLLALAERRRSGHRSSLPVAGQADLLALYGAVACGDGASPYVLAHLGHSLDACIATASGHAHYVTGQANLIHLHRLRALADVVLVGAQTARADDPQLTTRLVEGPSPVRVILDRRASLSPSLRVFTDGAARTLRVCANQARPVDDGVIETLTVPEVDGRLCLAAVRDALVQRGLPVIFVEGGGVTVTQCVERSLLDRLHIAVAPVLIGRGTPGLGLPSAVSMATALRPAARRYRMGDDVLWDLDMRTRPAPRTTASDEWPQLLDRV